MLTNVALVYSGARKHKPCSVPDLDLNKVTFYSQSGEDRAVLSHYFLKPLVCHGTFVEIGALDGIRFSNTKVFEDRLGWNGVLIEAEPQNAKALMVKRPHTRNYAVAVCPEGQTKVTFEGDFATGRIVDGNSSLSSPTKKSVTVPCRTMASILRDAGVESIDFFSLDVEGAELIVLQTMDWSIPVHVFLIEMDRNGKRSEKDQQIADYMQKQGYREANWNVRQYCRVKLAGGCKSSVLFEIRNATSSSCPS